MKVLIDADFLLEFFINRENLIKDAEKLWTLLENQEIQGLVTDVGLERISIFVKKLGGIEAVKQITSAIESIVNVKIVDKNLIQEARSFDSLDFESAVEIVCAYAWKVDAIVTQNIESFSEAKFHICSEAKLHILSISQLLKRHTLEKILSAFTAFTKGKNNITSFIRIVFILMLISIGVSALEELLHYLSGYKPSFSYKHSGKGLLASSDFYDNPFGLRGEDNSLTSDFYNDTRQDKDMVATFDIEGIYTLEDEGLILSDTDSQLGIIPEIQFYWQEEFHSPTNYFYDDSRENMFFYDNPLDSHPQSIPLFNRVDGDNVGLLALVDEADVMFPAGDNLSISVTLARGVPEPVSIIGLAALAGFGLVNRCTSKKNKRNNKNNLRKPETIPPLGNLDFIIDNSTKNKGNG